MSEKNEASRPDWVREAEEALDRATESIRSAWAETHDSRMSALGSAKQAAKQLGEAIDRGVETVRSSWQSSEDASPPSGDDAAPKQQSGADEEE